jgi:hypothetical protein
MSTTVEVRCPVGPKKLFTKLKLGEEFGKYLPNNLIEFTCTDCAKTARRRQSDFVRVFHSFNFVGELIDTRVELIWECRQPPCSRDKSCCAIGTVLS